MHVEMQHQCLDNTARQSFQHISGSNNNANGESPSVVSTSEVSISLILTTVVLGLVLLMIAAGMAVVLYTKKEQTNYSDLIMHSPISTISDDSAHGGTSSIEMGQSQFSPVMK